MIKKNHYKDIDLFYPLIWGILKYMKCFQTDIQKVCFSAKQPHTQIFWLNECKNFNELAASNALVRPGAMNTIGKDYIARKHGKQSVAYIHQVMKDFTEDTYGCILYQEQVMQACVYLGGMTMAEADKVRKIIGKKKDAKEFNIFQDRFVAGASKYISPNKALDLWHDFEEHAGYCLTKATQLLTLLSRIGRRG